jgi:ABC-2 type transport system permease protein
MTPAPSPAVLLGRQLRYQLLSFWRTPIALFFTVILPLTMLVLFNALFGGEDVTTDGGTWPVSQFYTGGLAAFTAVSATFTNLANLVPIRRDEGVLKRWRGTPLPPRTYVAGLVAASIVIAACGVVLMLAVGVVAYDLVLEPAKMPAGVVSFLVGVATFAALGLAVAAVCPSAQSAPAVANATILPLAFISDVFIAADNPPGWMEVVGNIFPLKPFVNSFQAAFDPNVEAPGFQWGKLAYVALWGVAGSAVALRWFKWEPPRRATRRRRTATMVSERS